MATESSRTRFSAAIGGNALAPRVLCVRPAVPRRAQEVKSANPGGYKLLGRSASISQQGERESWCAALFPVRLTRQCVNHRYRFEGHPMFKKGSRVSLLLIVLGIAPKAFSRDVSPSPAEIRAA